MEPLKIHDTPARPRAVGAAPVRRRLMTGTVFFATTRQRDLFFWAKFRAEARSAVHRNTTMKILHVLDHSLPLFSGYAFRSAYILANQKDCGLELTVVTSPKHAEEAPVAANPDIRDNVRYFRCSAAPYRHGPLSARGLKEFTQIRLLRREITRLCGQEKFGVVHAHSPFLNGMAALKPARRFGIPITYEIRAFWEDAAVHMGKYGENSMLYRLMRRLETWLCARVDHVFVICQGLKSDLVGRGIPGSRITVVANGVDTALFAPRPPSRRLLAAHGLEGKKVVGYVGSFYHYEGIHDLLEAMARIGSARSDVGLLLVGSGDEFESVKKRIAALGLGGMVTVTGSVPHEQIFDYYSIMDALVYPRRSIRLTELVTALKPLEAMAMERPVVASNVGGLLELVQDNRTGFVFPAGDADALAARILDVLGTPPDAARIGRQARAWVCENRTWDRTVRRHADVYARLARS